MAPSLGRCSSMLRNRSILRTASVVCRRCIQSTPARQASSTNVADTKQAKLINAWRQYRGIDRKADNGAHIGYLGKKRTVSKHLSFADLTTPKGETIQICSNGDIHAESHAIFRQVPAFSPVIIQSRQPMPDEQTRDESSRTTVYLDSIQTLNSVPKDLIVTPEVVFPQTKRHLQIRFHPELQARLEFRSWLKNTMNSGLVDKGFTDIETPTLFKSTSEGAREFLVPTRQRGTAYALSQSPQQYKQVLIASGISRYMQWARCYRDEDLRADRQPEFSQLDMEWGFADAATVRQDINDVVLAALHAMPAYQEIRGQQIPVVRGSSSTNSSDVYNFTNIKFADSIAAYGTDKPDLRIPNRIQHLKDLDAFRSFVGMITHLPNPRVEAFAFQLQDCSPDESRKFVFNFMESLPPSIAENPDGKPQVLVYDSSKPRCGFSSLGFEYETVLDQVSGGKELQDGDIVVFQAREEPVGQYCSGSTKIGEIRNLLWAALVEAGFMLKPKLGDPGSLQFAWVTEFPMFKPTEEGEPGQGGAAGFAAAHHPFTAPLSEADLEQLFTNPLEAKSAAYDLVLNGVEIGGGSERIHIADVQDFIMRDILKMTDARIKDFSHLFEVLRSGCPPHAGFALGFDRMVALMTDTSTVRDVMAFPKTMKGEDPFVKSPSKINNEQLAPYGLQLRVKS